MVMNDLKEASNLKFFGEILDIIIELENFLVFELLEDLNLVFGFFLILLE